MNSGEYAPLTEPCNTLARGASPPPCFFLWKHRVLYLGSAHEARQRRYGTSALVLALDHPMQVRADHTPHSILCRTLLIPPRASVHIDSGQGTVAVLFLDVFQQDYHRLKCAMTPWSPGFFIDIERQEPLLDLARGLLDPAANLPQGEALLTALDLPLNPLENPVRSVDPRVIEAIKRIQQSLPDGITTRNLADALHLSVPRVVQLFRQELGVNANLFQCLHRLHHTILAVAGGQNLTDAALQTGFVDVAHFGNTFKRMMGIRPSRILAVGLDKTFVIDPELNEAG